MHCNLKSDVIGEQELQHTNTRSPAVQTSMVAAFDRIALFFDDIVVGAQHDSNRRKTAHFQVDCCNGTNSAAANNENGLLGVSHCIVSNPGSFANLRRERRATCVDKIGRDALVGSEGQL